MSEENSDVFRGLVYEWQQLEPGEMKLAEYLFGKANLEDWICGFIENNQGNIFSVQNDSRLLNRWSNLRQNSKDQLRPELAKISMDQLQIELTKKERELEKQQDEVKNKPITNEQSQFVHGMLNSMIIILESMIARIKIDQSCTNDFVLRQHERSLKKYKSSKKSLIPA